MITEPFTILLTAAVVVGLVFLVIHKKPRWRGFGLLASVITGLILGNIGVISPEPGVLPQIFSATTYIFVSLMIMTIDVRRIFGTIGRPFALFWGVAAFALIGGVVGFFIFRDSLGADAATATAIVAAGGFGHSETQLAVAAASEASHVLSIVVAVALVRVLFFELVGFATVPYAEKINKKFLRPKFFYATNGADEVLPHETHKERVDEGSIAISLGWAGLITLISVLVTPLLGWGSVGTFVSIIVLSLSLGTFGGKRIQRLQEPSHAVGTYFSFLSLTLIGATTSFATLLSSGGPILGVMLVVMAFTLLGGLLLGKLMRVDWATIAITLVMADTGTASGAACAVAYGAKRNVSIAVITSLSGSVFGVFVGLAYLQALTLF